MQSDLNSIYISQRLSDKLARISEYPITTIVSPAGYGKTTAIKFFKENLADQEIVIKQNIFSNSIQEFWTDFSRMIGQLTSKEVQESLKQMGIPSDGTTRREFLYLFHSHDFHGFQQIYLVIDDCQLIQNEKFYEFILFAGKNLPDQVHLVLLSRTPILKIWDKLLFSGKVNEINEEDLRFEVEDVEKYFAQCGYQISNHDAQKLFESSEGWIAVLYLNLVSYADTGKFVDASDIYSMMGSILYDPLPEEERKILTAVSLLPYFTAQQAAFITGQEDVEKQLQHMTENNAFIKFNSGAYHLHHLLQEHLINVFYKMPKDYRVNCLHHAGQWYMEHDDTLLAAKFFYKAEDFHGLMCAIEKDQGISLLANHQEEMMEWFQNCPPSVLHEYPVAMLIYARRLFTFNEKEKCADVLMELLSILSVNQTMPEQEKNNLLGEVEIVRSFLDYNNIEKMSLHHRKACKLMNRPTTAVSSSGVWGYGSPSVLTSYYRVSGTLDKENEIMQEAMPYWYHLNPNQGSGAEYIFEGEMHFLRGEFVDADICFNKALYDAKRDHQLIIIFAAYFLKLRIDTFSGDFSQVNPTLQTLRNTAAENREYMLLHTADVCEAWLYALNGQNINSAAGWIIEGNLSETRLLFPTIPFLHMTYGQVLLAQQKYTNLIAREKDERELYRYYPTLLCEIYLDIQLAAAYEQLGKNSEAEKHLEQAIKNAGPDRLWMPFAENYSKIAQSLKAVSCGKYKTETEHIIALTHKEQDHLSDIDLFGDLTPREMTIARYVAEGDSNKEIAAKLFLSENTIKSNLRTIFSKLSLTDHSNKRTDLKELFQNRKEN